MNNQEKTSTEIGDLSEEIFTRAAIKYKTSVTAQAMYIALECRKAGIYPAEMQTHLIDGRDSLVRRQRLSESAAIMHKKIPEDEKPNIEPDSMQGLKGVASRILLLARAFEYIPTDELTSLLKNSWETYQQTLKGLSRDKRALEEARYEKMIVRFLETKHAEGKKHLRRHPLLATIERIFTFKRD